MDHGNHGGSSGPACKISMLWNWYTVDACFLTSSWHITSRGAFAATCIGVVLMVVLLEALRRLAREYDEHIQRDFAARVALITAGAGGDAGPATAGGANAGAGAGAGQTGRAVVEPALLMEAPQTVVTFRASPLQQLVRALLHTATFGLAYIIMLLAMYYNGYVIISILIGALLGKFLCDWMTRAVVIGGGIAGSDGGAGKRTNGGATIDEPTVCCG
ncbi:Ctr-domain-containing protein [Thermothelomyces heterothallicus CBS 203.75]